MTKGFEEYLSNITSVYEKKFIDTYKEIRTEGKKQLLTHCISFYRRWYYSALLEDSVLTPANLIDALRKVYGLEGCTTVYPVLRSRTRAAKFNYKTVAYSIDDHPVITDLSLLLESCAPACELDEGDVLLGQHLDTLLNQISLYDPIYVNYLLDLAMYLKLMKKMPSIYANQFQTTKECELFFNQPKKEMLDTIIKATISIATRELNTLLPGNRFLTYDYILSILKEPITTDDLFKHIYSTLGFSIEKLMEFKVENSLDDVYNAMVSSTFYLGVVLDNYFFTPFGFYLHLINPGYMLPYDLEKEIAYAMEALEETGDIDPALFSPCSHYTLTPLGLEYFQQPNASPLFVIPENMPIGALVDSLICGDFRNVHKSKQKVLQTMMGNFFVTDQTYLESNKVYQIKARLKDNKAYWKTLEFLEACTLHDVYMELCYEFNFELNMNYSFFREATENPFSEYTSPVRKKQAKSTDTATLKEFGLIERQICVMALYDIISPFNETHGPIPQKCVKLELEVRKVKDKGVGQYYPCVVGESTRFQELEMDWFL